MRRAQAEMVGLLILVIILVFALLIYLRLQQAPPSLASQYQGTQFGQAFVSSLLQSNLGSCSNSTAKALSLFAQNNREDPCQLETAFRNVLHATLDEWGYTYHLSFQREGAGGEILSLDSTPPCVQGAVREAAGSQPIPLRDGQAELRLDICHNPYAVR